MRGTGVALDSAAPSASRSCGIRGHDAPAFSRFAPDGKRSRLLGNRIARARQPRHLHRAISVPSTCPPPVWGEIGPPPASAGQTGSRRLKAPLATLLPTSYENPIAGGVALTARHAAVAGHRLELFTGQDTGLSYRAVSQRPGPDPAGDPCQVVSFQLHSSSLPIQARLSYRHSHHRLRPASIAEGAPGRRGCRTSGGLFY